MRSRREIEDACDTFAKILTEVKCGGMDWHAMTASVGVCKWILGEEPYNETMVDLIKEMKRLIRALDKEGKI